MNTSRDEAVVENDDQHWMALAIAEAKKGLGRTQPNPAVGAVVVRNGACLATGYHHRAGEPHAERDALNKLEPGEAKGATIYVTLEPCSTQGRTGPCTGAILEAGIQRVVYATADPTSANGDRARAILGKAGVEVVTGIREEEALALIRGFTKVQKSGRPWVILKTAMSLDGRITRPPSEGQWLTGPAAREEVHRLRNQVDAIATSGQTVRRDNPRLDVRLEGVTHQLRRFVFSQRSFSETERQQFQIFGGETAAEVIAMDDLESTLKKLAREFDVQTLLLECGGRLAGDFVDKGLVDEFFLFLAPIVCGGSDPAIGGAGAATLAERFPLKDATMRQFGPDLLLHALASEETTPLPR